MHFKKIAGRDAVEVGVGNPLPVSGGDEFEFVAAAQSLQVIGPTGGKGDYLGKLIVIPTSTAPGAVSIQDGTSTATLITLFNSSTATVMQPSLQPFEIPLGIRSVAGAWRVTTGAAVSVLAIGYFTPTPPATSTST